MIHEFFIPFKNKEVFTHYSYYVGDEVETWLNENIGKGFTSAYKDTSKIELQQLHHFWGNEETKCCYIIHHDREGDTEGATFYLKTIKDKALLFKLTWG